MMTRMWAYWQQRLITPSIGHW